MSRNITNFDSDSVNRDDVFKKEFDIYHANQPSLYLLLSLMSVSYCRLPNIQWTDSLMQLTDWNRVDHQKVIDLYRLNIFSLLHHSDIFARIFSEFLQDASRAGKYTVTAETFACASLKLLEYLSCYRPAVPINIQYTHKSPNSPLALEQAYEVPWSSASHANLRTPKQGLFRAESLLGARRP